MESLSNYQELWDRTRTVLATKYAESIYNELFKESYVYRFFGNQIVVIVPTPYVETKINRTYLPVINEILAGLTIEKLVFKFQTKASFDSEVVKPERTSFLRSNNLDTNYSFENFVKGDSNILAFRSAMKVAETPGVMNPLYIFGSVGLGKTHLIQAIGNYVSEVYPHYKILYVQSIDFIKEYSQATQTKNMTPFIEKYDNLDLLLVDDIQQLAIGDKTQFEFFNLFNEMYMKHKQIVIASDCPANKLKIMDRLSSRFASGMVVDITPPDLQQRIDILKKKMEERNVSVNISNEALEFIANNFTDNIRILDGALTRVLNYNELVTQSSIISLDETKVALDKLLQSTVASKTNDIDTIIDVISEFYQVSRADLVSPNRNQKYVLPRQICMYLLKNNYDLTYSKIGKILGGRDHSTVMSGSTKIEKEIKSNPELKSALDTIISKLKRVDE